MHLLEIEPRMMAAVITGLVIVVGAKRLPLAGRGSMIAAGPTRESNGPVQLMRSGLGRVVLAHIQFVRRTYGTTSDVHNSVLRTLSNIVRESAQKGQNLSGSTSGVVPR